MSEKAWAWLITIFGCVVVLPAVVVVMLWLENRDAETFEAVRSAVSIVGGLVLFVGLTAVCMVLLSLPKEDPNYGCSFVILLVFFPFTIIAWCLLIIWAAFRGRL